MINHTICVETSLSNVCYSCNEVYTDRNNSPENDAGAGKLCLPIPRDLIKLQGVVDEVPRGGATVTVGDAVLAGQGRCAPW